MTTIQQQLHTLSREVRELREHLERLVPLDDEGAYNPAHLKKLDRARVSKARYSFKGGSFSSLV